MRHGRMWHRRVHDERAQGLVEFALLVPALLLFFLGTIDFSRFMYYDAAITNAARTGALAASTGCVEGLCGRANDASINDYIVQATSCESADVVTLHPQVSCTVCVTQLCSGGPCASTPCTDCANGASTVDICIVRRTTSSCTSSVVAAASHRTPTAGQCVQVYVGYNFRPVAPLISRFFPARACWTGDVTTHTLCASSAGKVF